MLSLMHAKRIDAMPVTTRSPGRSLHIGLALVGAIAPTTVWAHSAAGAHAGVYPGMLHPFSGFDHLLVMLGVGLLAWLLGGKALWRLPLTFVAVMGISAMLAADQLPIPGVETALALTVLLMGLLLARGAALPIALAWPLVAGFAVLHGVAHGSELPADAAGLAFGVGFILATALLHGIGVLTGLALQTLGQSTGQLLGRAVGLAMSISGALLLAGVWAG
jgi:urease accessory protein